jgi:type I restriction enzyme M protein
VSRVSSDKDFQAILFKACDRLRGNLDSNSFKTYLLTILFLRYVSSDGAFSEQNSTTDSSPTAGIDQIDQSFQSSKFPIDRTSTYNFLYQQRRLPGNAERIQHALVSIESANKAELDGLADVIRFNSSIFGNDKQSDPIFCELLELLPPAVSESVDRKKRDIGYAYDAAIEYFAALEGKRGGEFVTPAGVSELLVSLLGPKPHESIYDPACGSGSLLLAAAQYIYLKNDEQHGGLYGQEKNRVTCLLAKMNMLVHGEADFQIRHGDTLEDPLFSVGTGELETFDVVVSHPPFTGRWAGGKVNELKYVERFRRGLPPEGKSDFAFILHMLASMRQTTSRMGVVVSHGVLFRGAIEGAIREKLILENLIDAVIGLPPNLFFNTAIPSAIILFRRDRGKENRGIFFIEASKDFSTGEIHNRNMLVPANIKRIADTYISRSEVPMYSRTVGAEELRSNAFNLNISRYIAERHLVDKFPQDIGTLRSERKRLVEEIQVCESDLSRYIEELGYPRQ